MTHPDSAVTTFTYDKAGNRASVSRATSATAPAFSTTTYAYDALNRLTDIINKNGSGAVVSSYHYQLRADGKRLSVTDGSGTTNYTYDDGGKLVQEAGPYATIAYGYDNVGNRLTRTVTNAATGNNTTLVNGTTTNTYDANDRLTSGTHSYDADGNETTVNGQTAGYDFENHLVSLSSNNTVLASYVYDADGNRYSTYSSSATPTTTSYVVDTSLPYASVIEEYTGTTPVLSARYDYGDDLVRMDRGSGVYYYIYDGFGSTRQLVNTAGAVTDAWGYSAFGELASRTSTGTPTANPFLFNAQQFDGASGDYYLRARYYDQSNGRFISQDPSAGSNEDPITLHRYVYANDDPIDVIDPSGQEGEGGLSGLSVSLSIGASFIAQNSATVLLAGVAVISAFDPDAGISIGETLPQAEGGAELGASANAIFSKSGQAIAGYLERIGDWRKFPGIAQGGETLEQITGEWFRGSEGNVGLFPKQIADRLRGDKFATFDKFREAFWKEVAKDPDLSQGFKASNLKRMSQGKAPFVKQSQAIGKARTYVLHHVTPINQGGGVYNMDNLRIVTPRYHKDILDSDYHYGN